VVKTLKVSEVRRQIYDLFAEVTESPRTRVVIEHRDARQAAVLISAEELARLERRARAATGNESFKLAGSARLQGDPLTVLQDVRADQRTRAADKDGALGGVSR
jgi:hypothetical protein